MNLQSRQPLVLAIALSVFTCVGSARAQGSPIPGGGASAPVPGSGHVIPGTAGVATKAPGSKYRDLPLTPESTKYRLDELREMLGTTRPQDMQDSVQELCEWLNDAADAHYRMYLSFAKSDLTKSQANSEKALNARFGQLKREAQLLRADLLIKQLRAPEALAPLVDIVVADPRSSTGQAAYKRLVELGFSQATAAPADSSSNSAAAAQPVNISPLSITAPVKEPANMPTLTGGPAVSVTAAKPAAAGVAKPATTAPAKTAMPATAPAVISHPAVIAHPSVIAHPAGVAPASAQEAARRIVKPQH